MILLVGLKAVIVIHAYRRRGCKQQKPPEPHYLHTADKAVEMQIMGNSNSLNLEELFIMAHRAGLAVVEYAGQETGARKEGRPRLQQHLYDDAA